ncbi:hypothetical protein KMT30_42840 [Streptomyces sp. IBSBF 2953]|uniref:hypothetical protein n=1 Tax=Streptomyces TaxID=1883 RepID=UPI00211A087D|nr:hypothetical protein [Streptomyces scabiei]MCQ9185655.1 hypothetical protein [Streptomyces hayashii]MDX3116645.1 hypothetical protein [Streptomyces scabiei]
MEPRFRRFGDRLMTCVALAWFGYQALYGRGMLRIVSVVMLVIGVVTTAGALLDRIRPRPKRRRSRERDAG